MGGKKSGTPVRNEGKATGPKGGKGPSPNRRKAKGGGMKSGY